MRPRRCILFGAVLTLAAPAALSAQARSCDLVQPADYRQIVNARGEEVIYFRDPVRLRCGGGVSLAGDSAVLNRARSALELVGAVVYRDSAQQLESDWGNYLGQQGLLLARGNVILTDLADSSMVTGRELEYRRETDARPLSHVIVRGGRPRALLRSTGGTTTPGEPAAPDTAAPLEVVADRLEFIGETLFLAQGAVELERRDMTGASDSARYDRTRARITLDGNAWVASDRYRLEGRLIDALLPENELREVVARDSARLLSDELEVEAERLVLTFEAGELERMEAWNPEEAAAGRRALALAQDFLLRADSIDARADSGLIREVRAVGRAYGERELDSLSVGLPDVVARDWIQGDTIIGYFAQAPVVTADPAESPESPDVEDLADLDELEGSPRDGVPPDSTETVLERVVVIGGGEPALSLYRLEPEEQESKHSINFMKATRIVLFLSAGEVTRVEAEGPIEGVYLDPVPPEGEPEAEASPPADTADPPDPTDPDGEGP